MKKTVKKKSYKEIVKGVFDKYYQDNELLRPKPVLHRSRKNLYIEVSTADGLYAGEFFEVRVLELTDGVWKLREDLNFSSRDKHVCRYYMKQL